MRFENDEAILHYPSGEDVAENALNFDLLKWKSGFPEIDNPLKKCVFRGASMEIVNGLCDGYFNGSDATLNYLGYVCEARFVETYGGQDLRTCMIPFDYNGKTFDKCAPHNTDLSNVGM